MPSTFRDFRSTWDWLVRSRVATPLGPTRSLLTGAALLASGAGVVLAMVLPGGRSAFQAGPVSPAHALFQNDCGACHREAFQTARRLVPGCNARSVPDAACVHCHRVGGHHEELAGPPGCAECHREHRGRPALARATNGHCLRCHARADMFCNAGQEPKARPAVTGFPEGHPPFAERTDPGQLRFNHAAHVRPEGVRGPDRRVVHLDCSHCHRPDETGRYMQPVRYAEHCASCHPLSVQLTGHGGDRPVSAAWARFAAEPAPHVTPAEVRVALRLRLEKLVRDLPVSLTTSEKPRREPWPARDDLVETVWRRAEAPLDEAQQRRFVVDQLARMEATLFDSAGGCAFCHHPQSGARDRQSSRLPEYAPTGVPVRWLTQARFRHDSHRMLECASCHPAASSRATADVLLPELNVCARCHNPRAGARHDCAGCHNYHERIPPKATSSTR